MTLYSRTTIRLPYPTEVTLNEHKLTGNIVEVTDDGEERTIRIILDMGHEMVATLKSDGRRIETFTDDDGITWAQTLDTGE